MSNSITASNSAAPFNSLLLTDANYVVTASWNGSVVTPAVNFNVANPYPTIANTLIYISATADTQTAASASSVYLQESANNSTWANVAVFAAPLLAITGSAAAPTAVTVNYGTNNSKQYLRLSGSASGAPTGSFTLTVLM